MDYKHINEYTKIYEDHKILLDNLSKALEEFEDHQEELNKLE